MRFALLLALMLASLPASAACIDVTGDARLSLAGTLSLTVFPGPPDYESVDTGDLPEQTYLLQLPQPICITDGGYFADPAKFFDTVHVYTSRDSIWPVLKASIGKHIEVKGLGFAAHTGHHRAPLVLEANQIVIE